MSDHLSPLALDRLLFEADSDSAELHLRGCERCAARLARLREDDAAFLARFPTLEALRSRRDSRPAAAERRSWSWPTRWKLALAGALVTASIAALVFRGVEPPERSHVGAVRTKGISTVELGVSHGELALPIEEGFPLGEGDVLVLRYTTQKPYLLLLSLESSGKVNVYITDPARRRSLRIRPGRNLQLKLGVELDAYVGRERIVALLSASPLEVEAVRQSVEQRFHSLQGEERDRLEIGPLPLEAEQFDWLIEKVRKP